MTHPIRDPRTGRFVPRIQPATPPTELRFDIAAHDTSPRQMWLETPQHRRRRWPWVLLIVLALVLAAAVVVWVRR